jgi:predicted XRE-type DNA-binding protein
MAKRTGGKKILIDGIEVFEGSGNVFADLGYPNPEEALTKARIAYHISTLIKERRLTQVKAAALLGIDQPKISRIAKGQVREFSTERLLRFAADLGDDIEIVLTSTGGTRKKNVFRLQLFKRRVKLQGTKAA